MGPNNELKFPVSLKGNFCQPSLKYEDCHRAAERLAHRSLKAVGRTTSPVASDLSPLLLCTLSLKHMLKAHVLSRCLLKIKCVLLSMYKFFPCLSKTCLKHMGLTSGPAINMV